MKVKCLHGYYIFEELKIGQVSNFTWITGIELSPKKNYFTFPGLVNAPEYSLINQDLLGVQALTTFEGEPHEVFEQNKVVFDITSGTVKYLSAINLQTEISQAGNKFISNGLIMAGARISTGQIIKNFSGFFIQATQRWVYSGIEYV